MSFERTCMVLTYWFVVASTVLTGFRSSGIELKSMKCRVTRPGSDVRVGDEVVGNYGNDALATSLWTDGKIVFRPRGAGSILSDGALSMKFGWWRKRMGRLVIEGRRLDAPAPPLRSYVPTGYGNTGFQALALIFPMPGCWQVTGHLHDESLTFVTLVERVKN